MVVTLLINLFSLLGSPSTDIKYVI
jgi:hypothetical protein